MLRFSDRLTSTSSGPPDQGKAASKASIGSSDESTMVTNLDPTGSGDHVYTSLVEMLGLHQTVKTLEAEYNAITGGETKGTEKMACKNG
jgi:hypothetical protein